MAEYIDYTQATTLFGDVDARFDTVEGKIPSNASSGNKMVTASDIATKADLVDGKVPAAQLPSFVDDVLEYASTSAFPATGETGKIYVALDTNKTYRWGGSDYVEISESLALGETSSTAYAGDKGKANADAISNIQDVIPSGASTSNKLATASDIPDTSGLQPKTLSTTIGSYTTVEGALSGINDGKVDKVTGKGLSTNDYTTADQTALQTTIPLEISQLQASLLTKADVSSVPTALSDLTDDSTHRVVTDTEKTTWSGKQDALTFDNTPTANSNNPVKSGGIKTELDAKMSYADNGVLGAKNLLPLFISGSTTLQGITYTVNSDGSITLNGTSTGETQIYLLNNKRLFRDGILPTGKDYIISGKINASGVTTSINCVVGSEVLAVTVEESQEKVFNVPSNASGGNVFVTIPNGKTLDNATIYPMLRLASDPDSTYAPYAMTNRELTEIAQPNDGVLQVGKLVVINKQFTTNSALNAGSWNDNRTDIVFPKPYKNIPVRVFASGTGFKDMMLGDNGNNVFSQDAIEANKSMYICCAYILK